MSDEFDHDSEFVKTVLGQDKDTIREEGIRDLRQGWAIFLGFIGLGLLLISMAAAVRIVVG